VNLRTGKARKPKWGPDSTTAEVATIQLEFGELSRLTGDSKYADTATRVMEHIRGLERPDGLVPIFINPQTGKFSGKLITLGARGDSYYEYLLKQWLQSGKSEDRWKQMYLEAVDGIRAKLVAQSTPTGWTFVQELSGGKPKRKMDHLVCFLPGLLGLGWANGMPDEHLELAKRLLETCVKMHDHTATGLSPEIVHFNTGGSGEIVVKDNDAHHLLRPETVESLFVLHRVTKDAVYVEHGWRIFERIERHCRVETGGYSSLRSVKQIPPRFRDKMESFFLGETLKYLFLLFEDPDGAPVLPLDRWVLNTEAHPLPIHAGALVDALS